MKRLDHVVLWTKDPQASMDFYSRVVGLAPVRFGEFQAGEAPFPSVRVCDDSIIDLLPTAEVAGTESLTKVALNNVQQAAVGHAKKEVENKVKNEAGNALKNLGKGLFGH